MKEDGFNFKPVVVSLVSLLSMDVVSFVQQVGPVVQFVLQTSIGLLTCCYIFVKLFKLLKPKT